MAFDRCKGLCTNEEHKGVSSSFAWGVTTRAKCLTCEYRTNSDKARCYCCNYPYRTSPSRRNHLKTQEKAGLIKRY